MGSEHPTPGDPLRESVERDAEAVRRVGLMRGATGEGWGASEIREGLPARQPTPPPREDRPARRADRLTAMPYVTPPRHCRECGYVLADSEVELDQGFDPFRGVRLPPEVRPRLACPQWRAADPSGSAPWPPPARHDAWELVASPAGPRWESQ